MSIMVVCVASQFQLSQYLHSLSVMEATKPPSTSSTGFMSISRKLSMLMVFLLQALHLYIILKEP